MAHIYLITNQVNSKKYVGKTTKSNPYDRWREHKNTANLNNKQAKSMPILRAIRKYGVENFTFTIIEECPDETVNERERHFIQEYNTCSRYGYNITLGGEGIKKPPKYWSNHPDSKPVDCYDLEGRYLATYPSTGVALRTILGRDPTLSERGGVKTCIKGTTFQSSGHRWSWQGEPLKEVNNRINRRGAVYAINPTTNEKRYFKSQADAAEAIMGDRKQNNSIFQSLRSPNTNKLQCKEWYFFRTKNEATSPFTPAERPTFDSDRAKKLAQLSKLVKARPVRGTHIQTNEVVEFESLSDASYYLKGDKDRSAVGNITRHIQFQTKHAYNHVWEYIDSNTSANENQ